MTILTIDVGPAVIALTRTFKCSGRVRGPEWGLDFTRADRQAEAGGLTVFPRSRAARHRAAQAFRASSPEGRSCHPRGGRHRCGCPWSELELKDGRGHYPAGRPWQAGVKPRVDPRRAPLRARAARRLRLLPDYSGRPRRQSGSSDTCGAPVETSVPHIPAKPCGAFVPPHHEKPGSAGPPRPSLGRLRPRANPTYLANQPLRFHLASRKARCIPGFGVTTERTAQQDVRQQSLTR